MSAKVTPVAPAPRPLGLTALNHISITCACLEDSARFYRDILGFFLIKRPNTFDFDGAWLFNYGIGVHLLQGDAGLKKDQSCKPITPKANHVSFQCEDMTETENGLKEHGIKYLRQVVEEGGIMVDQLFFHDPDGHMIEICNCQLLPIIPLSPKVLSQPKTPSFSRQFNPMKLLTHPMAACGRPRGFK